MRALLVHSCWSVNAVPNDAFPEGLELQHNRFRGTIPETVAQMTNLRKCRQRRPHSSVQPSLLTLCSFVRFVLLLFCFALFLGVLDLSYNFLTGSVDTLTPSAGTVLNKVSLHHNELEGTVPDSLCRAVLRISSDCNDRIECDCCTECVIGNG